MEVFSTTAPRAPQSATDNIDLPVDAIDSKPAPTARKKRRPNRNRWWDVDDGLDEALGPCALDVYGKMSWLATKRPDGYVHITDDGLVKALPPKPDGTRWTRDQVKAGLDRLRQLELIKSLGWMELLVRQGDELVMRKVHVRVLVGRGLCELRSKPGRLFLTGVPTKKYQQVMAAPRWGGKRVPGPGKKQGWKKGRLRSKPAGEEQYQVPLTNTKSPQTPNTKSPLDWYCLEATAKAEKSFSKEKDAAEPAATLRVASSSKASPTSSAKKAPMPSTPKTDPALIEEIRTVLQSKAGANEVACPANQTSGPMTDELRQFHQDQMERWMAAFDEKVWQVQS